MVTAFLIIKYRTRKRQKVTVFDYIEPTNPIIFNLLFNARARLWLTENGNFVKCFQANIVRN